MRGRMCRRPVQGVGDESPYEIYCAGSYNDRSAFYFATIPGHHPGRAAAFDVCAWV